MHYKKTSRDNQEITNNIQVRPNKNKRNILLWNHNTYDVETWTKEN